MSRRKNLLGKIYASKSMACVEAAVLGLCVYSIFRSPNWLNLLMTVFFLGVFLVSMKYLMVPIAIYSSKGVKFNRLLGDSKFISWANVQEFIEQDSQIGIRWGDGRIEWIMRFFYSDVLMHAKKMKSLRSRSGSARRGSGVNPRIA